MLTSYQKKIILDKITPYQPTMIGLFGSYARNEEKETSDLDLMVDFHMGPNYFELVGLEQELSEKLGIKVDLVTRASIKPALVPWVNKDLVLLLDTHEQR